MVLYNFGRFRFLKLHHGAERKGRSALWLTYSTCILSSNLQTALQFSSQSYKIRPILASWQARGNFKRLVDKLVHVLKITQIKNNGAKQAAATKGQVSNEFLSTVETPPSRAYNEQRGRKRITRCMTRDHPHPLKSPV